MSTPFDQRPVLGQRPDSDPNANDADPPPRRQDAKRTHATNQGYESDIDKDDDMGDVDDESVFAPVLPPRKKTKVADEERKEAEEDEEKKEAEEDDEALPSSPAPFGFATKVQTDVASEEDIKQFILDEKAYLRSKDIKANDNQRQFKLGAARTHHINNVSSATEHSTRKYPDIKLRTMRWLSTLAHRQLGTSPELEIQSLYDPADHLITICENTADKTQQLKIDDQSLAAEYPLPLPRFTRHRRSALALSAAIIKFEAESTSSAGVLPCGGSSSTGSNGHAAGNVASLQAASAASSLNSNASASMDPEVLPAANPDPPAATGLFSMIRLLDETHDPGAHAEIRLVNAWLLNHPNRTGPRHLYVAGMKRPCFACHTRLEFMKRKLSALQPTVILHTKEYPGPYWVCQAALKNATYEELNALHTALREPAGITVYLNPDRGYHHDTDSEDDEDDDKDRAKAARAFMTLEDDESSSAPSDASSSLATMPDLSNTFDSMEAAASAMPSDAAKGKG